MEDISALDLLKEEMETEEIHLKVNVIHRLKTVILAIGVEDTIKKLIPCLESNLYMVLIILQLLSKEKMMKCSLLLLRNWARFGMLLHHLIYI